MFIALKCSFLLFRCTKSTFRYHNFKDWVWHSFHFLYLSCFYCGYYSKLVSKFWKFFWMYIFSIEMFILAIFVEKNQCWPIAVSQPSKFFLIVLFLLSISEEICLKDSKALSNKNFPIEMFIFTISLQKWNLIYRSFREWAWLSLNFIYLSFLCCYY